jgi:hypothetical protein
MAWGMATGICLDQLLSSLAFNPSIHCMAQIIVSQANDTLVHRASDPWGRCSLLSATRGMLAWMDRRHQEVAGPGLGFAGIAARQQISRQPGACCASAAIVTGGLDPYAIQAGWLAATRALQGPLMVVIADQAPPNSLSASGPVGWRFGLAVWAGDYGRCSDPPRLAELLADHPNCFHAPR